MEQVVVNCEAFSLPDEEHVADLRREALELIEAAAKPEHIEAGQKLLAYARSIEDRKTELGPIEEIRELTDEEEAQREADLEAHAAMMVESRRGERNARLAASDWTQGPDAPLTDAALKRWSSYRQELRDLTFNDEPDWPEVPK